MATRVQSNIKQAAHAATWTIRFSTGSTVAGNTLVILTSKWGSGFTISAVSDPVNGAWTQVGGVATGGNTRVQAWIKENAGSITTAQDISVVSNGGDMAAVVIEYSGQLTASSLDPTYTATTGNGSSSGSTSVTTGSITTAVASDTYIVVAAGDGSNTTWTAPTSPWTFVQQNGTSTFIAIATEDRINADAAGAYSQTVVNNVSENKAAKIFALQPAAGGGGFDPATLPRMETMPLIYGQKIGQY